MSDNVILNYIESRLAEPAPEPVAYERSLAKGLLAGLIGGLVATAAKSLAERVYPPRTHGEPEPPDVLVDQVSEHLAGHPLTGASRTVATEAIHWTFGAAAGAAYGGLAEYYPAATARQGTNFGMTLMALTHEGALPALGLSAEPSDQTGREKASEMASHVVFGFVAETVRGFLRARL